MSSNQTFSKDNNKLTSPLWIGYINIDKKRKMTKLTMNSEFQTINLVMLIGNNPETNYINSKILKISEFAGIIVTETSGRGAIEYLKKNADRPACLPEVILIDIGKPAIKELEFLNAFEQSAETIKNRCKIIILSNSFNVNEIDAILKRRSVAGYVSKPLLVEKLKILKSSYLKAPNKKQKIN